MFRNFQMMYSNVQCVKNVKSQMTASTGHIEIYSNSDSLIESKDCQLTLSRYASPITKPSSVKRASAELRVRFENFDFALTMASTALIIKAGQ
jgi:NADPH-dependent 7-cyano-7-deazaguanine reductase QueF-like protein